MDEFLPPQSLTTILDAVVDGIALQDRNARIVYANSAVARIFGFASGPEMTRLTLGEVLQRFELSDENGQPLIIEQLPGRRVFQGVQNPQVLCRCRDKSTGAETWVMVGARPLFNEQGEVVYSLTTLRDITEQKQLQQQLEIELDERKQIEINQNFLEAASTLLVSSLDYEQTIEHVVGLATPTIADWCVLDLLTDTGKLERLAVAHIDPAKRALAYELNQRYPIHVDGPGLIPQALRSGKAEYAPEVSDEMLAAVAHDQAHLALLSQVGFNSIIAVPLIARGRTLGVLVFVSVKETGRSFKENDLFLARELGRRAAYAIDNAHLYRQMLRDIAERDRIQQEREQLLKREQAARREAERANQLKLQFLAMVSHELRTPLTSIKGFATTLLADDVQFSTEDQRYFLEVINDETDKLNELVEQLLMISRMQAGTLSITPSWIHFADIVHAAFVHLQTLSAQHRLVLDLPDDLPMVLADTRRIAQVLANLISNAAKFSPPQSEIVLRARSLKGGLQVSVSDQGEGIAPEYRELVFEAFRQVGRKEGYMKGAGLGLAICKGIISAHLGRIWVEDTERGTTISFTLPSMP